MRLYRGLEKKFNKEHDLSTTDAPSGYSTWTNNKELARQYAGVNGFVYSLDLDDEFETEEMLDMDGDRGLFLNNQKKAGLNGVSGDEYLVYTHHEEFNPNDIKLVTESKRNPLNEGFAGDFMKAIKKPFKKVVYTLDNTEPLSKDQDFKTYIKNIPKSIREKIKTIQLTNTNQKRFYDHDDFLVFKSCMECLNTLPIDEFEKRKNIKNTFEKLNSNYHPKNIINEEIIWIPVVAST